jgi:peptide/nickel transport system permease protein
LLGGVVVVEAVFNYPGIGSLLTDGVSKRDLPLVQALVLLAAAIQIGLSFIADAVSLALNPRLRSVQR